MINTTTMLPEGSTVYLRLTQVGAALSTTIKDINHSCDLAEDSARCGALVIHIQDSARELGKGVINTQLMSLWERALKRIEALRVPVVCVIERDCFGLMFELMLCTDHRIAGPNVTLGLAHANGSLWPGMAIYRLSNQLGVSHARQLVLFDTVVEAAQAVQLGLLNSVDADPLAACDRFTEGLLKSPLLDMSVRRHLLLEGTTSSYEAMLGLHMAACDRTLRRESAPQVAQARVLEAQ